MKGNWAIRRYMGEMQDEVWHILTPTEEEGYDNSDLIILTKRNKVWMVDDSFSEDYAWRPVGVRTLKEAKVVAATLWRMR